MTVGVDVQMLVGFAAAPALIPVLVAHLKGATRAFARYLNPTRVPGGASPWPLVSDLVGVAWAFALWDGGLLPVEARTPALVVLLGVALGIAASTARDTVARRQRGAPPEV